MGKLHIFTCDRCDFREETADRISQSHDFHKTRAGIGITYDVDLCPACWEEHTALHAAASEQFSIQVLDWLKSWVPDPASAK